MTYRIDYRRYRLPFRAAVRTAHGRWAEREGVLLRLESEQGGVGIGEAAPIPWFGTETVDEVEAACRELGSKADEARLASVPERLVCLRNALVEARGMIARGPVAAVTKAVEAGPAGAAGGAASYLSVAALLPAGRAALGEIAAKCEAGFRVFKWKVGVADLADELVLLDDLCAELPDGATLRLDANGAWDRRRAERCLERCAERPVEFLEQPIAPDARGAEDLLLGLAGDFPTPIALDESLVHARDIERWLGAGWPGVYVVKPSLLADVDAALRAFAAAKASVVFSSALETAVGARAALRHAFDWTGTPAAVGFGVWPLFGNSNFNGPLSAPFFRRDEIEAIDAEEIWNALR